MAPAVRRAPGRGEVEIRVRAAGLNFRDVLWAMGLFNILFIVYPAPLLDAASTAAKSLF